MNQGWDGGLLNPQARRSERVFSSGRVGTHK